MHPDTWGVALGYDANGLWLSTASRIGIAPRNPLAEGHLHRSLWQRHRYWCTTRSFGQRPYSSLP